MFFIMYSSMINASTVGCGTLKCMKILAVDIGTGTQDIYLYNSNLDMENNFKMIVPSPTMIIHQQIKQATERRVPILLTGVTMGGGPSAWAAETHLQEGLTVYATPEAAKTFNDDLEVVKQMGVLLVSEDEAMRLPGSVQRLFTRDFDLALIRTAFQSFGIELDSLAAVVVAVFDHGNAPPQISDRQFRFDYLDERIRKLNRLSAFAYRAEDVPEIMTRLKSVVDTAQGLDVPLIVMDTAPAAVLGAMLDPAVAARERVLIANVGNFHTLAFRMGRGGIEGLFEHHTGLIDRLKVENLLLRLADGSLRNGEVFDDHGHGALVYNPSPLQLGKDNYDVVVTGPRRGMFQGVNARQSRNSPQAMRPYFPAPFGDMMITGCFGLLAATADLMPDLADSIHASLNKAGGNGTAPWDTN
jgi:uncharacterized protein (DUF1786 family)